MKSLKIILVLTALGILLFVSGCAVTSEKAIKDVSQSHITIKKNGTEIASLQRESTISLRGRDEYKLFQNGVCIGVIGAKSCTAGSFDCGYQMMFSLKRDAVSHNHTCTFYLMDEQGEPQKDTPWIIAQWNAEELQITYKKK
jgi:ABC-type Fe3+-hydroxamate transport system substrate-binding protein